MPWTAKTFKAKHNKGLSDAQAKSAATMANSILQETGDEGKAIRIANSQAKKGLRHMGGGGKTREVKHA